MGTPKNSPRLLARVLILPTLLTACQGIFGKGDPGPQGPPDVEAEPDADSDADADADSDADVDADSDADTDTDVEAAGSGLPVVCSGGGFAEGGSYSAISCVASMSLGGAAQDGRYTLQPGPIVQIAPAAP